MRSEAPRQLARAIAAMELALLLLWPCPAAAEDAARGTPQVAGGGAEHEYETTVTGKRRTPPGASGSSLTRAEIEALPGGDAQPLSYALAAQPGFVSDTFGFGLHVRGADGGILYVVDGIPLTTPPLGQLGATVSFLPARLVENLRVLTGGFPAEYSAGAGAVIVIETRHALGGPAGEAQVGYGTYRNVLASLDYSQQVGRLGVFVGGSFQTTSRGFDPPSVSPILHDDLLTGGGLLRADYRLGVRDRLELIATFDQSRFQLPIDPTLLPLSQAPPGGAVRGPDRYGNEPPPLVPYDANPVENERNLFAALAYRHAGRAVTLQVAPFFRESFGELACDPAGSLGPGADPGSTCSDVRRDVLHGGALASLGWRQGARHAWRAGAVLDLASSRVDYAAYSRDDTSPAGGPDPARTLSGRDLTSVLLAGLFLQDRVSLGKWTLMLGARLDLESAGLGQPDEPALFLLGPSARLGVTYAATRELILHAFAGYLWQPPSTLEAPVAARVLLPSLAGQALPVDIRAEKDWSFELGLTGRVRRWLSLGLTGWGRLAADQLDRVNVGSSSLIASYNFERGRAAGVELSCLAAAGRFLDGFANLGWQLAQGQGISSERFLFSPEQLADPRWVMLDHVQTLTANLGFDLHDPRGSTHLSALVNYGSGLRTGADSDQTVPSHVTLDLTLRHRFELATHLRPEVALDVFNLFDEIYALRIGTGYVGSAYGPLRRVLVRLMLPLP